MEHEPTISVTTLRLFVDSVERLGVDRRALCRGSGLAPEMLEDGEARITFDDYQQVFEQAAILTNDPCVGLRAGAEIHPRAVNLLGYLLLALYDGLNKPATTSPGDGYPPSDRPWGKTESASTEPWKIGLIPTRDPGGDSARNPGKS